jgi:hypothetical protein
MAHRPCRRDEKREIDVEASSAEIATDVEVSLPDIATDVEVSKASSSDRY